MAPSRRKKKCGPDAADQINHGASSSTSTRQGTHQDFTSQPGRNSNDSVAAAEYIPIPDRGHGILTTKTMDPFEVRLRFTQHLQYLNASVTSANKAAQYALKYRDMAEDLHSCILEQLERNTMNNRANIMYFIEHLCNMAERENHQDYVRMMQRDILRIVDAVAPEDGSGAANVKVVRKVLNGLNTKNFLLTQTVLEIEELLKERDTSPGLSLGEEDAEMGGVDETPKVPKTNGVHRLDKKLIEQRIEEDRERHKRLREKMWAVPGTTNEEYALVADDASDFGDDDEMQFEEDMDDELEGGTIWKEDPTVRL